MKKNKKLKSKPKLKTKKPFLSFKTRTILWAIFSYAVCFACALAIAVFGFEVALAGPVLFGVAVGTLPVLLINYLIVKSKSLECLIYIAESNIDDDTVFKKHFDAFISKSYASEIISSEKFDEYYYSADKLISTLYAKNSPHLKTCSLALINLIEPGEVNANKVINQLFDGSCSLAKDISVMSALLNKGVITEKYKSKVFMSALESRDLALIKLLRLHDAKIDVSNQCATLWEQYNGAINNSVTEFSQELHAILDDLDFSIQLSREAKQRLAINDFPHFEAIQALKENPEILSAYNEVRKSPKRLAGDLQVQLWMDKKWRKACTTAFKNA